MYLQAEFRHCCIAEGWHCQKSSGVCYITSHLLHYRSEDSNQAIYRFHLGFHLQDQQLQERIKALGPVRATLLLARQSHHRYRANHRLSLRAAKHVHPWTAKTT